MFHHIIEPSDPRFASAPVSIFQVSSPSRVESLFIVLTDFSVNSTRALAYCRHSENIVGELDYHEVRALTRADAMAYVNWMLDYILPGSKYLIDPDLHQWWKVQGRFHRVRTPYMHLSKSRMRKAKGAYPSVTAVSV
jgi:hypothetical protein